MKKVAILGSGTVGDALAKGFVAHGYEVRRGSRTASGSVHTFVDASAWCELAVLCVKGTAAEGLIGDLASALDGKVVLDTTNPIGDEKPDNGVLRYFTGPNDSLMERMQKRAPNVKLVKAFNSVGAAFMVAPPFQPKPSMFICGNDAAAKATATEINTLFGWETIDMGGVEAARPIEALCQLWCAPGLQRNEWAHAFKYLKL